MTNTVEVTEQNETFEVEVKTCNNCKAEIKNDFMNQASIYTNQNPASYSDEHFCNAECEEEFHKNA